MTNRELVEPISRTRSSFSPKPKRLLPMAGEVRQEMEVIMATLTIELPEGAFSALRRSPQEFAKEMRIAASVQWYAQQQISQEKAAEIAGLSRVEFLNELFRRRVPASQVTLQELVKEIERDGE